VRGPRQSFPQTGHANEGSRSSVPCPSEPGHASKGECRSEGGAIHHRVVERLRKHLRSCKHRWERGSGVPGPHRVFGMFPASFSQAQAVKRVRHRATPSSGPATRLTVLRASAPRPRWRLLSLVARGDFGVFDCRLRLSLCCTEIGGVTASLSSILRQGAFDCGSRLGKSQQTGFWRFFPTPNSPPWRSTPTRLTFSTCPGTLSGLIAMSCPQAVGSSYCTVARSSGVLSRNGQLSSDGSTSHLLQQTGHVNNAFPSFSTVPA
jgi:hypothetical protein